MPGQRISTSISDIRLVELVKRLGGIMTPPFHPDLFPNVYNIYFPSEEDYFIFKEMQGKQFGLEELDYLNYPIYNQREEIREVVGKRFASISVRDFLAGKPLYISDDTFIQAVTEEDDFESRFYRISIIDNHGNKIGIYRPYMDTFLLFSKVGDIKMLSEYSLLQFILKAERIFPHLNR